MTLLAADIIAKFYGFLWPLTRIAAALMTVPVISIEAANARIRIILAIALTLLVYPLHDWPTIDPISARGLSALLHEIAIGVMTGLTLQVVTAALVVAGQSISTAMGLSMSNLLDPSLGNVPVLSQFLVITGTMIFLGIGGPTMLVSILLDSFTLLPVGQSLIDLTAIANLLRWSSMMFLGALLISLPVVASLLLINVGLGVVTRAAPSLNIFAVGFPAMIVAGFLLLLVSMGGIVHRIQWLWLQGFDKVRELLGIG